MFKALLVTPTIDDVLADTSLLPEYISSRQRMMQISDYLWLALCVVTIAVLTVAVVVIYLHINEFLARRYIHRHLQRAYFCGYPLDRIIQQRFWPNLEHYLDLDLSEMAAFTVMSALQSNRTAQLVSRPTHSYRRRDWHTWVVFRFGGVRYAVDPLTYEDTELVHSRRFKKREIAEFRIFSSQEFWHLPVCRQLGEKLQSQPSSYLFYEILKISGNPGYYASFAPYSETAGHQLIPLWLESTRVVAQNILDGIISNSSYQEPSTDAVLTAIRTEIKYQFPKRSADLCATDYFATYCHPSITRHPAVRP